MQSSNSARHHVTTFERSSPGGLTHRTMENFRDSRELSTPPKTDSGKKKKNMHRSASYYKTIPGVYRS
ncbi:hypothetical protein RRG08_019009 [Elysia crispata]|uniref:Uncharacterized protein n=1 Tax=Elysia crispata TaxID=231223 RepID=A0AAE1A5M0_9GAST|nr:hypothetical protein RRG08_019009 [Elysia crispata]